MKYPALVVLGLFLCSHVSRADVLGGAVEITPVPGWVRSDPQPGKPIPPLPTLRYVPKDGRNASVILTLVPKELAKVTDLSSLKTFFQLLTRPYLPTPDTIVTPSVLKTPQGLAIYASFVDPALVGKPSKKDDYKTSTPVAVLVNGGATLHVSVFTDSLETKDFSEAMKIVQSAAPHRAPPGTASEAAPATRAVEIKTNGRRMVTVASLGSSLGLPARFEPGVKHNSHPSYFIFTDENHVNLSGWLERAVDYTGLRELWTKEKAGLSAEAGMAVEENSFSVINGWTAVLYTVRVEGMPPQKNIHACRVVGDTWADVHLSILKADSTWKELEDVLKALSLAPR